MNFSCMLIFTLGVLAACNNTPPEKESKIADSTIENVIDNNSVKESLPGDTAIADDPATQNKRTGEDSTADKILVGRHNITLHWIGWNKPGSAVIEKVAGGWYNIKGKHQSKTGYLSINGKLKPATGNPAGKILKLHFDGVIEYKGEGINNNQPCTKKGEQIFLSTQGRKYWRLQNMLNCDGNTTDYVDIYF